MTLTIRRLKYRAVDPHALQFREWRENVGLSQANAATLLGYKSEYLANVELGVKAPSKAMLVKMRALIDGWGKP